MKRRSVEITQKNGQILVIVTRERFPLSLLQLTSDCGYSIPALCERLELSERHLRRIFMEGIGISPKDWMRQQRMVAARKLLREGSAIKEVALDLGYTNSKMFSRDFMEFHGVTPTDFQRKEFQRIIDSIS